MRILRLDLERYGAFEGRSLAFRPDARLHVVFGPNEAGKSSALAAVSDLLFGFDHRSDFAFRHGPATLRLGATLAASNGETVSFRRRKGTKATILDADDKPLRDDLIAPLLGSLGREVFERAFGLSAEGLRRGVTDLLAAEGDSGASLFAAASGLRGVEDLRKALEGEADGLFRPQASTRRFNEESRRYEAARKTLAEQELGANAWRKLNETIEALEGAHRELRERRAAVRTERARVERLVRAHAAAVEMDRLSVELDAFADLPEMSPAAAAEIAARLDAADAAAKARERAAEALRRAEGELDAVALDEAVLGATDEIERLTEDSGAFRKSQDDLPRVQREAVALQDTLARLAVRLGVGRDADEVEPAMPTDAARAALGELIREGRALEQQEAAREEAIAAEEGRRHALADQRGDDEPPADPAPLREALAALAQRLRPLERREELAAEAGRETAALGAAAGRLSPQVHDLAGAAARRLPSQEAIAGARKAHDARGEQIARAEEARRRTAAEIARLDAALAAAASGAPIATPDAIEAARALRDAAWRPLRAHLLGREIDPDERIAGVAAFETSAGEADRLADRLAADAGRAAEVASLARALDEAIRAAKETDAALEALRADRAAALDDWRALWAEAAVEPAGPAEMEAWRKEFLALVERRERNEERLAAVARLDAAEAALRPELQALAAAAGLDDASAAGALALAARIEARLGGLAARWDEAARLAAQVREVERRLERLAAAREEAEIRNERWRARWASAAPALGLARTATLGEAEAALAAWGEAPGLVAERANRKQRIAGMSRDADAFAAAVGRLARDFAPELSDLPPEAAARRLSERLTVARQAEARRADAARRRDEARLAREAAERSVAEASGALADLPDAPAGEDARAALDRVAARGALRARLAEKRDEMLRLAETADEAELREALAAFDPDAAPAAVDALHLDERHLDEEGERLFAELDRERRRRDGLGGAGAERAAAEQRSAAAAMAATAREWAVLRTAALLLGAALERARQADRSPVLDRAAALFATLTGGGFAGFAEDYEAATATLVAVRASGERVGVKGLSEGTRDQFYLALRLASLEDYAARAEPAPFIGDDLFASFDDDRTANGLRALAEIGERVQPILFTHHRSVVAAARSALGAAVDVIDLGPASA